MIASPALVVVLVVNVSPHATSTWTVPVRTVAFCNANRLTRVARFAAKREARIGRSTCDCRVQRAVRESAGATLVLQQAGGIARLIIGAIVIGIGIRWV